MRFYCPHCRALVGVEIKEYDHGVIVDREIICGKCQMTIRGYTYEKNKKDTIYTYQKEDKEDGNAGTKTGKNRRIIKRKT